MHNCTSILFTDSEFRVGVPSDEEGGAIGVKTLLLNKIQCGDGFKLFYCRVQLTRACPTRINLAFNCRGLIVWIVRPSQGKMLQFRFVKEV